VIGVDNSLGRCTGCRSKGGIEGDQLIDLVFERPDDY